MKTWIVIAFVMFGFAAKAADYPYSTIADSLKTNAVAVKRYEEKRIEILSTERAKIYTHYVTTILSEAGDEHADCNSWYDKFVSINYISGTLYNADGKEIKHIKTKDCKDESYYDGFSLMSDNRSKKFDFNCRSYPYTVEYEEEDEDNGIFSLDYWMPQENEHIAVELSKLTVIAPANLPFRYKQMNYAGDPVITQSGDKKIYTWQIKNIPAKLKEPFAPAWKELVTSVSVAPSNFKIEGYEGNMNTWSSFGVFMNSLLKGRDALPDALKQKVHEIADHLTKPEDKVNTLYQFLQQNTRYVSVQLGIGGWQPFDASYVYSNKYGDCKALSNYMVAMLKEAGIKADYVLIEAGRYAHGLMADFPSNQFNHATVCVPLPHDTMWLECTSQTFPANYISDFTGNRQAVLIDEAGGHVVNTIHYTAADNVQVRNIKATIDDGGKLTAEVHSVYKCLEGDDIHKMLHFKTKKEQLEQLKNDFDIPTYDVVAFSYNEGISSKPATEESLQIAADNYATITGKRMFVMPDILTKNNSKLSPDDDRKFDVCLLYGYTHIDTIHIQLPKGYEIEAKPKDVTISNEFGDYNIRFQTGDDEIICQRYFKRAEGRFAPSAYSKLVTFYDAIYKADHSKFVFVKKV